MDFKFPALNVPRQPAGQAALSLRCPACKQHATLDYFTNVEDIASHFARFGPCIFGQRRCPNPSCHSHVFVVGASGKVIVSYPPERLDFEATDVPQDVREAFEEAIACHSQGCFVAAAMMVRKTLEELCRDKGAKGGNLKEKIAALGGVIVLPKELLSGADDLRLLGNDAAHIESQEYANVGKEEVEVAVEFAKELLKAVYQYAALLQKLKALKKAPQPPNP